MARLESALLLLTALLLCSAITAGILITTATTLDVTAMATGTESVTQLSDRVDVLDATGQTTETTIVTTFLIQNSEGESVDSDGEYRQIRVETIDLTGTNLTDSTMTVGNGIAIETDEINATAETVTPMSADDVEATITESDEQSVESIKTLRLRITSAPGSSTFDIGDSTVEYIGITDHHTLVHAQNISADSFATTTIIGGGTVLEDSADRFQMTLDVAAIRDERVLEVDGGTLSVTTAQIGLFAGDSATVTVVAPDGATTEYGITHRTFSTRRSSPSELPGSTTNWISRRPES